MYFKTQEREGVTVIVVELESLDASNANDLKSEIKPEVEGKIKVIMDISKVEFVDSSGLGAILSTLRTINSRGGELVLCGMTKTVRALFELVRMHKIVDTFNDEEEAIASFK